jgi:hypothetical protein
MADQSDPKAATGAPLATGTPTNPDEQGDQVAISAPIDHQIKDIYGQAMNVHTPGVILIQRQQPEPKPS